MTNITNKARAFFASTLLVLAHSGHAQTTQPTASSAPVGAVVLFDGTEKSLEQWTYRDKAKSPAGWTVADGAMTSQHADIYTRQLFTDFTLHVEFNEPKLPDDVKGQARGNSGVYLQGRYEIQVLDSYGLEPTKGDCGAIYNQKAPDSNACLPADQWQTYDITFKAAKFDANGKKIAKARVTVILNGKKVQDDVEIDKPTGSELLHETAAPGPLLLQFHHNSIKFRNVWIVPN